MGRRFVARAELCLGLNDALPLRELPLDPDPLSALLRAFRGVDEGFGDAASVCVDVRPVSRVGASRVRARWRRWFSARGPSRSSSKKGQGSDWLADIGRALQLEGAGSSVVDAVDRRLLMGDAARKYQHGSLWELQVLIRCVSEIKGREINLVQGFVSAFSVFSGANHFRVVGVSSRFGVPFFGSDSRLFRGWFDYRFVSGLFAPRKRSVVVASEVSGLLKPPTVRCREENAPRAGALVGKPPSDLPVYRGQKGVLPLGRVWSDKGERRVGARLDDFFFDYKSGKSRFGKTELALAQIIHLGVVERQGVFYMDPHTDGVQRLRPYLVDVADRVIDLDLSRRGLDCRHVCWNLFSMEGLSAEHLPDVAQGIVDSFLVAARWQNATRALAIIGAVAESLLTLSLMFTRGGRPGLAPTIWTVPRLLEDEDFRLAVSSRLPDELGRYWRDTFMKLPPEAHSPIVNLVSRLRRSATLRATLGSPVSTYRPREAIDSDRIVLVCPGGGREKLVANFLVQAQIQAILSRRDIQPAERRWVNNFFDEAQSYDSQTSGSLPELLEQCGKYKARVSVLNQSPDRLSPATLDALGTNSSALITTQNSSEAAGWFAKQWSSGVLDAKSLVQRLDRYTYLAQVAHGAARTEPFLVLGDPIDDVYGPGAPQRVRELEAEVDRRYRPRTVSETLTEIEGHDDRIFAELRTVSRSAGVKSEGVLPGGVELREGF